MRVQVLKNLCFIFQVWQVTLVDLNVGVFYRPLPLQPGNNYLLVTWGGQYIEKKS